MGPVPVDQDIAAAILAETEYVDEDESAHQFEHSLEVQVPFIQLLNPSAKILPITIGTNDREMMKKGQIIWISKEV